MSTPTVIALIAAASALGSAVISGVIATLLGSYLQRQSIEHQISFASLHERRAGVIDHIYKLVVRAQRAFPLWMHRRDSEDLNKRGEAWLDAMGDLDHYYQEHALWLDDGSRQQLDHFLKEATRLAYEVIKLAKSEELAEYGDLDAFREQIGENPELAVAFVESLETSIATRKRISDELDTVREALGSEFRRLLGAAK
jgi:hypothetical protein